MCLGPSLTSSSKPKKNITIEEQPFDMKNVHTCPIVFELSKMKEEIRKRTKPTFSLTVLLTLRKVSGTLGVGFRIE